MTHATANVNDYDAIAKVIHQLHRRRQVRKG